MDYTNNGRQGNTEVPEWTMTGATGMDDVDDAPTSTSNIRSMPLPPSVLA
jgi:hypothetical protein